MKAVLPALIVLGAPLAAQQLDFPKAAAADRAQLDAAIPALSLQAMGLYREPDQDRYLSTLVHLQMAAGQASEALTTIQALRDLRRVRDPRRGPVALFPFEAAAAAQGSKQPFDQAFRERLAKLDDRLAVEAENGMRLDPAAARADLDQALEARKTQDGVSLAEAVELIRKYQVARFCEQSFPKVAGLVAEDDLRRYLIQDDVLVRTPDGASVSATVVRPRSATGPLPTVFAFTVYADGFNLIEAKRSAAHGFAGVVGNTRGKRLSPEAPIPYEHDGADADAVIEWIAQQPWSDGQVGMYGGSYDGFTQWAAAKHRPKALKSLMPSVAVAPGLDTPMEGGVFANFLYKWIPYVTNNKSVDEADYNDFRRWNGLDWTWFTSGRPYRDLDKIDGRPNPLFRRWLDHPTYDAYWQAMVPVGAEFTRVDIPVLMTTGYFDGCELGSFYYFGELMKHAPEGERFMVVGPYDHIGAQRYARDQVQGYTIDPAAWLDVEALRYAWMDHTLKGGPLPAMLKGRVNYEVMGANAWKAAPSLEAMANGSLAFHLDPVKAGDMHLLSEAMPPAGSALRLRVDLADRNILKFHQPMSVVAKTLDADNAFTFASAPLKDAMEVSGAFSGRLDFSTNKKDFDLTLELYALTPQGDYVFLSSLLARASHLRDRSHRHLLTPGKPQSLPFRSGRPTSRKLEAGSRLVLVLGVDKQPRMQMNYGSGKDVSDESMADAATPLEITWRGSSVIRIPVWK